MLVLYLIFTGIAAGFIGPVVGIGGGVLIVPVMTLFFKIPIHLAIGTSIVSVLVTSLTASIRYFRRDILNIPLGLALAITTTIGGIAGGIAVNYLKNNILFLIFGFILISAGIFTFFKNRIYREQLPGSDCSRPKKQNPDKNSIFDSSYFDQSCSKTFDYRVKRIYPGSALSVFGGIFSGLLGVGGGVINVPVMHLIMDIPVKVATTTSTFIIAFTATAASIIHFSNGFINPSITIPVITGVLIGAAAGSFATLRIKSRHIGIAILIVFTLIGISMFLRGTGIIEY